LEPAAPVAQERIRLADGNEVLVLAAPALAGLGPFTFDGRPYHRVGSTTTVLPRESYEARILQNVHPRHRWETMEAYRVSVADLDANEILRTVRLGIESGRLPETTGADIPEILDRLELRVDGSLLNAAVVLFGVKSSLH
jgi:ATP-dependent DNA helicase RecG